MWLGQAMSVTWMMQMNWQAGSTRRNVATLTMSAALALGVARTEQVLKLVRRLAERGLGVILISHNLNEIFEVADDIAVLYLGQMVAQVDVHTTSRERIVTAITTGQLNEGDVA